MRIIKRKLIARIYTVFIAAILVSGVSCFPRKEYRIGVVGTETGPYAEIGLSVVEGIKLRCEEINESKKKLNKRYITCVHYDDAGEAGLTESLTRRLVGRDEVVAVIIASASREGARAAARICAEAGVPVFSVSGFLTEAERAVGGCYELGIDGSGTAAALVEYLQEKYRYERAGLVTIGEYKAAGEVKNAFRKGEGPGALALELTVGTTDVDLIAATPDIRFAELDVLYVYGSTQDTFRLARELEVDGVFLPIANIKPFAEPTVLTEEVTTTETIILISPVPTEYTDAEAVKFERHFRDLKGYKPNFYSALGYDAINLITAAIDETDDTAPEKLVAEWDKLGVRAGIVGVTDFRTGSSVFKSYVVEVTIIANKPVVKTLAVL